MLVQGKMVELLNTLSCEEYEGEAHTHRTYHFLSYIFEAALTLAANFYISSVKLAANSRIIFNMFP